MLTIDFRLVVAAQGNERYTIGKGSTKAFPCILMITRILFIARKLSENDMALPISLEIPLFCILAERVGSYLCT